MFQLLFHYRKLINLRNDMSIKMKGHWLQIVEQVAITGLSRIGFYEYYIH